MPFENGDLKYQEVTGNTAAYNVVSANQSLFYKGTEFSQYLAAKAGTIVGWHIRSSVGPAVASGTGQAIMRCSFQAKANTTYTITVRGALYCTNTTARWYADVRLKFGYGVDPTLASGDVRQVICEGPAGSIPMGYFMETQFRDTVDRDMRLLVSYTGVSPASSTFRSHGSALWPQEITIREESTLPLTDTGVDDDGSATPPKTLRSFDIQPFASRSYDGGGGSLSYDNQYMMQGDIGIDGNRRSWAWFNIGAAGSGSIADMAGVSAADTQRLELFLYYPHWYNTSGGRSVLGRHNQSAVTATEQGGGVAGQVFTNWEGRNIGKWIDLRGTDLANAIRLGIFRGIILGNTGSASRNDYGYAYGANGTNGQQPGLRASYYK